LSELPQELLIEAVKALLPPDFLGRLASTGAQRSAAGTGAGQSRKSKARGRPAPSRPGRLDGQSRVDVIATLRSAAPWQKLRAARKPLQSRITIFPNDIHLKRYEQRAERLVIFIVDASGSAAMARLAEAKGAVELLLAEAYARRDYVALIAFRGASGDLMLPPTRSLVQTKRRLSSLPGGGGDAIGRRLASRRCFGAKSAQPRQNTRLGSAHRWTGQYQFGRFCKPPESSGRCRLNGRVDLWFGNQISGDGCRA
ncbi:hypothetical protein N9X46_07410, partial [Paracoccaceae bacterium]|nr:hypothetical protein [Paracoccaceae bacterium]